MKLGGGRVTERYSTIGTNRLDTKCSVMYHEKTLKMDLGKDRRIERKGQFTIGQGYSDR